MLVEYDIDFISFDLGCSLAVSISSSFSLELPIIKVSAGGLCGCGCLICGLSSNPLSNVKILATSDGVLALVLGNTLLLCLLNENNPSMIGVVALLIRLLCASPVCCCLSLICCCLLCKSACKPMDSVSLSGCNSVDDDDDDEDDCSCLCLSK